MLAIYIMLLAASLAHLGQARSLITTAQNVSPGRAAAPARGPLQPPSPGAGKAGSPPQTEPSAAQQQPGADCSSTEQPPLVVKVPPAPKTDAESEKERGQSDEKSSTDRWLMIFTGGLLAVGLIQVI